MSVSMAKKDSALQAEADLRGTLPLYERLQTIDPVTASRLHQNDAVRIIRALEVYTVTGAPISHYQARDREARPSRSAYRFGLTLPRPALYAHDRGRTR